MDPDISELIRRVNADEPGAQDALFAAAYGELRKLARSRLRDGGRNTVLDTTSLVHESYLRLINGVNLRDNIKPTRERARLVLEKSSNHSVQRVRLRRI